MLITNSITEFLEEAIRLFPVQDFSFNWGGTQDEELCTYHDTAYGVVRVKWVSLPTQEQLTDIGSRLIKATTPLSDEEAKVKRLDSFIVSDDVHAKALRGLGRTILASLSNFIGKYNKVMDILASGRFPTPAEVASLKMPVRDFTTLMEVAKAAIKGETNPNK